MVSIYLVYDRAVLDIFYVAYLCVCMCVCVCACMWCLCVRAYMCVHIYIFMVHSVIGCI